VQKVICLNIRFHTKRYNTEVTLEDGSTSKYKAIVHEFDTSETSFEIVAMTKT
jgi:hypothetical protein